MAQDRDYPGYIQVIRENGDVLPGRSRIYLDAGIDAYDSPNDQATRFTAGGSSGAGGSLASITALRAFNGIYDSTVLYRTRGGFAENDGGGANYRWDDTSTATDDGVLVIKTTRAVGRMKYVNQDSEWMFNGLNAIPALADGSRSLSFDPTGVVAAGTELKRVTGLLRVAGYKGMNLPMFGVGRYLFDGTEEMGRSLLPWQGFSLRGSGGATLVGINVTSANSFGIYADGEIPLLTQGYGPRTWTGTIAGGEKSFAAVAVRTGLFVGDTMFVRLGADPTDASGMPAQWMMSTIDTITNGSGTTATIVTELPAPEPNPASAGINVSRIQTQHDMIKVVAFQDNTTIEGFDIEGIFFATQGTRNLKIDCKFTKTVNAGMSGFFSENTEISNFYQYTSIDNAAVPDGIVVLQQCYGTHFGKVYIDNVGGPNGGNQNLIAEELSCRGTRIDELVVVYDAANSNATQIGILVQSGGATNIISVGHCLLLGGVSVALFSSNCRFGVFENNGNAALQSVFVRADQMSQLVTRGHSYSGTHAYTDLMPIKASVTNTFVIPQNGAMRRLRIKPTSMTGVTSVNLFVNGLTNLDISGQLTSGQWNDIETGALSFGILGYTTTSIVAVCDGTVPAGTGWQLEYEMFIIDLVGFAGTLETSTPRIIPTNGAPTANSAFVGQEAFDVTNSNWYRSVSTGSGASDWKVLSLPNVATAGTTGDATHVAQITVDAQGRTTSATAVAIAIPSTALTDSGATGRSLVATATVAAAQDILFVPEQLHNADFTTVSSVTTASWTVSKFRRIEIHLDMYTKAGTEDVVLTAAGLSAASYYVTGATFVIGSANAPTDQSHSAANGFSFASAAAPYHLFLEWNIPTSNQKQYTGRGTLNTGTTQLFGGINIDSTHDVHALTFTFTGNCSGHLEVLGYI